VIAPWQFPVLFVTGLVAGFVDAIAGGGGLITLPVLLSLGLPPQQALGTNKLQATFGSGSAALHYARAGLADWRKCGRGFALTFLGAALGTLAVRAAQSGFLERLIPWMLLAVLIYVVARPTLGEQDARARMSRVPFDLLFGLALGFYDGFFGPGTGTFWTIAFVGMLGFNLARATAETKLMNFASNLSSLAFFLPGGNVVFAAGLVMGAGQFLGARLGSKLVLRRGTRFIRPVFLTVVLALTIKLLMNAYRG
jgi:uncharacterized membrane protein YfcA